MNVTSELRSSHSSVSRDHGFVNDSDSSATMASRSWSSVTRSIFTSFPRQFDRASAVTRELCVRPAHVQRHEGMWVHRARRIGCGNRGDCVREDGYFRVDRYAIAERAPNHRVIFDGAVAGEADVRQPGELVTPSLERLVG